MKNHIKKQTIKKPLLSSLFQKIGEKLGVQVIVEEEFGIVGQITYKNGIRRYFRWTTVDLNPVGASDLARDKDYSKIFMNKMGYPVIPWKKFYSDRWANIIGSDQTIDKAWEYAQDVGLPVFLKPNSRSQGTGVTKVFTKREFFKSFKSIIKIDNVILVEQPIMGKDYRVVVLDNEVISAYERIPLTITGDGKTTILNLLHRKQKQHKALGRDSTFSEHDERLIATLKRKKYTMETVLSKDQSLQLLYNANLSTGGDSVDVTKNIHPFYKKMAIQLTKDMGLRICGVDLLICGDITTATKDWCIIEINAAPGLDHYAAIGKEQYDIVEALYTKVFIAMGKK